MSRFVIHEHGAKRAGKHFDLRLENRQGSLSSWAVPRARMPKAGEKFYAHKVEDHPMSYVDFEGEIESGYGAGTVKVHDTGKFEDLGSTKNKIKFRLRGKKETGSYVLVRTGNKSQWLLIPLRRDVTERILEHIIKREL